LADAFKRAELKNKAGSRVRIIGQLVDATTGTHLWADPSCLETERPIALSKARHGANNAATEAAEGFGQYMLPHARQRGLIVVIFDPAPLVRAPAQQTKAPSAELENGQSGAHSRMMAIYAHDAFFRDCASGYSGNCGKFHTAAEDRAWRRSPLIRPPHGGRRGAAGNQFSA